MESRWQALQRKVLNFYDNRPVMAWGCFIVIAGTACWHSWSIILPVLASTIPGQPVYHFMMATLSTAVALFMGYCRIQRFDIVLSQSEALDKLLQAHDGPIPPEFLEILSAVAEEHGVKGKFEAFLAHYDPAALPTTQVVYGRLITLAEEAAHEKAH